ncbi:MAG: DUF3047 domain-containing protein [Gammaproteobacteria bacterium]
MFIRQYDLLAKYLLIPLLNYLIIPIALLLAGQLTVNSAAANDNLIVGNFSAGELDNWESKSFKGITDYRLVQLSGIHVLRAESKNTASGLFKKQRIDLKKTPYMNWRWRIERRLGVLDEQSKSGDDYAARVYVVTNDGWAFWRTRAINYVWANSSPPGKTWPNAFVGDKTIMIALRSNHDKTGTWYHEKRNILRDVRQHVDASIHYIDAVALMTDTDNSNSRTTAYYGDIYFTKD